MHVIHSLKLKKSEINCDLRLQTVSTAQALREAHILLNSSTTQCTQIPFVLTNALIWSFGLAKKSSSGSSKIVIERRFHISISDVESGSEKMWHLVSCLRSVISGEWPV